ncbi:protein NO VEIN domain-containing protein [Nocardia sp. NPDC052316]|uniref:protein NO VEIN domain-containing protein n=1 Tax=Nocardia sp. NPDC052316 TaxID=3364329 RepID=UPI0037C60237
MLPLHGAAYSTLLLTQVALLTARRSIDEWVDAARGTHGRQLASQIEMRTYAQHLVDCRLASIDTHVKISPRLLAAARFPDGRAMCHIAQVMLRARPPFWLYVAVKGRHVQRELIPTNDLNGLLWLEPRLDQVLVRSAADINAEVDNQAAKALGDAAELLMMAALEYEGSHPVHIAQLSDAYGYDIEVPGRDVDCIEVKAATSSTSAGFHITRNEFDTAIYCGTRWRLIQIVLSNTALLADKIGAIHVEAVRELTHDDLQQLIPEDTDQFRWEKSAGITVPPEMWRDPEVLLDPDFVVPGKTLGSFRDLQSP